MCLILHRNVPFKLHETKLPTPRNICVHFHLHYTLVSHNFLTFLTFLMNLLMNVYFVSVHALAHCMPALHTQQRKKKLLSTYGAQANSSEEMLTSR